MPIEKAVFSYFNPTGIENTCGFDTFQQSMASLALAVKIASYNFKEVEVVSNNWGLNIIEKFGLPATLRNDLEELKGLSKYFWAYGKIKAYSIQDKPFLHIDNDCFMWDGIPEDKKESRFLFQSREYFRKPGYGLYLPLKKVYNEAPVKIKEIVEVTDYVYNCGVCGGTDVGFFKEWVDCSHRYITAPENQDTFFKNNPDMLIHQNLFHEQYFGASLILSKGLRKEAKVLANDASEVTKNGYKFTHMWGLSKRNDVVMGRMLNRLKREDPQIYLRVIQNTPSNEKQRKITGSNR